MTGRNRRAKRPSLTPLQQAIADRLTARANQLRADAEFAAEHMAFAGIPKRAIKVRRWIDQPAGLAHLATHTETT